MRMTGMSASGDEVRLSDATGVPVRLESDSGAALATSGTEDLEHGILIGFKPHHRHPHQQSNLEGEDLELESLLPPEPHHRHHHHDPSDEYGELHLSSLTESAIGRFKEHRSRKVFSGLPLLDTLDVLRESARLLRKHSDLLTTLTAVLICPISIVLLTHVLVTRKVIDALAIRIEASLVKGMTFTDFYSPYFRFMFVKLAEFLVTAVVNFPLAVTLDCLACAGVVYTVASTYVNTKISLTDILLRVVTRVWIRLIVTFMSCCLLFIVLGFATLLAVDQLKRGISAFRVPSVAALPLLLSLGLVCLGIFLTFEILLNVARVACVLEGVWGFSAIQRAWSLVRGRKQVAIWCYMITAGSVAFLELLFGYRVTGSNDYTDYNSSASWEGPLLILMHSFVYLFDDLAFTVFYFTCPTCSDLENFHRQPEALHEYGVTKEPTVSYLTCPTCIDVENFRRPSEASVELGATKVHSSEHIH